MIKWIKNGPKNRVIFEIFRIFFSEKFRELLDFSRRYAAGANEALCLVFGSYLLRALRARFGMVRQSRRAGSLAALAARRSDHWLQAYGPVFRVLSWKASKI